jgi:hypothetical protein
MKKGKQKMCIYSVIQPILTSATSKHNLHRQRQIRPKGRFLENDNILYVDCRASQKSVFENTQQSQQTIYLK